MVMDFNLKAIKGLAAEAATVFTRAVQYTEEKLGTSEKTELDQQYEELASKCDKTKLYTEKIVNRTMSVLEPNPNVQMADYVLEKLDKKQDRPRNLELLGSDMIESGLEFGPHTIYGSALIKVGQTQQKLGKTEKEFVEQSIKGFVRPLSKFLDEDIRTIMRERKILEARRLDLDAAKNRIKKAKSLETQANAEQDLKITEEKFDRQVEITKLLLEGISSAQTNHVRCLSEFIDSQINFYTRCHQQMIELQRELAVLSNSSNNNFINNQANLINSNNKPILKKLQLSNELVSNSNNESNKQKNGQVFKINEIISPSDELEPIKLPTNKKRARVLYDYEALESDELNLSINEVIIINLDDSEDPDFLLGERGLEKGKVPVAYLEIMN